MSYWGKVVGGMVGFAMGGPPGAVMGAALGHAADSGALPFSAEHGFFNPARFNTARIASFFAAQDQVFSLCVISLSAKLAKCDGAVTRLEIEAFKRHFRVPPQSVRQVGRAFDRARLSSEDFEAYAVKLGEAFASNKTLLEDVLAGLFAIAAADGPANDKELRFLSATAFAFKLDGAAWNRARAGQARPATPNPSEADPYAVLGVPRSAPNEAIRATWKKLMRENHPDSLASRGVPADFIARASEKVAQINAAWDRIKRERKI